MEKEARLLSALKRLRLLKDFGEKDLTLVDIIIMLTLFGKKAGSYQREITETLSSEHSVGGVITSQSLKKLIEKHGLVKRAAATENYRLNILSLTSKGETLVSDILRDLYDSTSN